MVRSKPRVLLADDHVILLESLKSLLQPEIDVVGTVTDGQALIARAKALSPEVIVTDIHMPHLNGLEACERLLMEVPKARVIFLTVNEDPATAAEAVRRGALGYILKKDAAGELRKAIETVRNGGVYISKALVQEPIKIFVSRAKSETKAEPLTIRQREVLQLLAEGKSMKEAADILQITSRTIAFHKYSMMSQIGIKTTSELVVYATEHGLSSKPMPLS